MPFGEGATARTVLVDLALRKLRSKIPALQQALAGRFEAHQRFLVAQQLAHIDFLDERVEDLTAEIAARLEPYEEAITRLETIPGVSRRTAEVLLAEIGTDMSRFPSDAHLAS